MNNALTGRSYRDAALLRTLREGLTGLDGKLANPEAEGKLRIAGVVLISLVGLIHLLVTPEYYGFALAAFL